MRADRWTYSLVATTPVRTVWTRDGSYLFISMLDHVYWIIGCTFGALFGSLVNFNYKRCGFCRDSTVLL